MNTTEKKSDRHGFTLAELLVVVAIIAVLVAVSIPIFSGQLEKARLATCQANRRSLKADLSAVYLSEGTSDAVSKEYDKVIKNYTCPSGGTISYTLDEETGVITMFCSKHSESEGLVEASTGKLINVEASLTNLNGLKSDEAITEYYQNNDSELPALKDDQTLWKTLFGSKSLYKSPKTLYWRPSSVTVNGKTEYVLFASATDYSDNNKHAYWSGYACYYNGKYYISTKQAWNNSIDNASVSFGNGISSVSDWLKSNNWTEAGS